MIGTLALIHYQQDIDVAKGIDTEHLKNKIEVTPPNGMTEIEFDNNVIKAAESFDANGGLTYVLTPIPGKNIESNCNSSSSTILYKAGISKKINQD